MNLNQEGARVICHLPFTTYNEMICQQVNLPPSCFNTNIAKLT